MPSPKKDLIIFGLIALVFASIYWLYTVPLEIKNNAIYYPNPNPPEGTEDWVKIKRMEELLPRLITTMVSYIAIGLLALVLLLFTYRAWKYAQSWKKETLQFFGLMLFFYMMGAWTVVSGGVVLLLLKRTFIEGIWYGVAYPVSIALAMLFAAISPIFMLKFSYRLSEGIDPPKSIMVIIYTLFVVFLIFSVCPYNWYGVYAPSEDEFDLRPATNTLLLLINMVAILFAIYTLNHRISRESDRIRKARLKVIMYGFLLMIGFFLFYALDSLSGQPYTIFTIISYPFAFVALLFLYIGTVAPSWFVSRLEKR